jgi:polyribonucleotide nucleotidyltransferase
MDEDKILAAIKSLDEKIKDVGDARQCFREMATEHVLSLIENVETVKNHLNTIEKQLTEYSTLQKSDREKIVFHASRIEVLDAHRNKSLGIVTILGILFGALAGWLIHIFKLET